MLGQSNEKPAFFQKFYSLHICKSILWKIMEIEEGDLHNSSYDTKAEFNNCFIIYSK